MKIEGRNTLVKRNYKLADIIDCQMQVFNNYWRTAEEIAQQLKGENEYNTCRNVWQYIIDNTQYKEDDFGTQFVKTPARLLYDKVGDCKSMSVLAASICTCLGIKGKFRYVGYKNAKEAHHVFFQTDSGIAVDPVEYFQKGHNFNEQTPYILFMDKPITSGLAILSGVDLESDDWKVLMNGSVCVNNTFALNYLYAIVDNRLLKAQYNPTEDNLYELNLYRCALNIYRYFKTEGASEQDAGTALQKIVNDGYVTADMTEEQIEGVGQAALNYVNSIGAENLPTGEVNDWWQVCIVNEDYKAAPNKTQEATTRLYSAQRKKLSGGVALEPENLPDRIKQSGSYYIYGNLTDSEIKKYARELKGSFRKKAMGQRLVKKQLRGSFKNFNINEATYDQLTDSGLITATKGYSASEWFKMLQDKSKVSAVGSVTAVLSIIVAVLSIIGSIIGIVFACIQFKQSNEMLSRYSDGDAVAEGMDEALNNDYTANQEDWENMFEGENNSGSGGSGGSGMLIMLAVAAFLLLRR